MTKTEATAMIRRARAALREIEAEIQKKGRGDLDLLEEEINEANGAVASLYDYLEA